MLMRILSFEEAGEWSEHKWPLFGGHVVGGVWSRYDPEIVAASAQRRLLACVQSNSHADVLLDERRGLTRIDLLVGKGRRR